MYNQEGEFILVMALLKKQEFEIGSRMLRVIVSCFSIGLQLLNQEGEFILVMALLKKQEFEIGSRMLRVIVSCFSIGLQLLSKML